MMRLRARFGAAAILAALTLSACATAPASRPSAAPPGGAWTAMAVDVERIGLGLPGGARLERGVRFAGGFELKVEATSPFRSLSDIKESRGWFYTVSDAGALFRFRLGEDATGEPVQVARFEGRTLTLPGGRVIADKADGDAEGLAVTDSGDLLVSFERDHRIWNYGAARDPRPTPTAVPHPDFAFPGNDGMEAISIRPGPGCSGLRPCLRVAGEGGGLWDCAPDRCVQVVAPPPEPIPDSEYRITGMDRDPDGAGFWIVERRFRPPADVRGRIRRMAADGSPGPVLVELSLPSTVDNFEGIAVERRRDGVRLYILSDDNNNAFQRTLLLAFDVTPAR